MPFYTSANICDANPRLLSNCTSRRLLFDVSVNVCDANARLLSKYTARRLLFDASIDIYDANPQLLSKHIGYWCFAYSYFSDFSFTECNMGFMNDPTTKYPKHCMHCITYRSCAFLPFFSLPFSFLTKLDGQNPPTNC